MVYIRHFVLFLVFNAVICANLTTKYLDTRASREIYTGIGDIFLPPEATNLIPVRVSWYGENFHGKPTASGERFDMNSISVAHISIPFGTKVMFFNPANEKQCDAVVNDSGPFDPDMLPGLKPHPKRQFDASKALAECLEFVEKGVTDLYIAGMYNDRPLTYEEVHSDRIAKSNERFAKTPTN